MSIFRRTLLARCTLYVFFIVYTDDVNAEKPGKERDCTKDTSFVDNDLVRIRLPFTRDDSDQVRCRKELITQTTVP